MLRTLLVVFILLLNGCGGDLAKSVPDPEEEVTLKAEKSRTFEYYAKSAERPEMVSPPIFADLSRLTVLGYIHYPSKRSMCQGRSEVLYTEIFVNKPEYTPPGLTGDSIRISRKVCADLVGHDDAFTITRMGERCQLVAYPSTKWRWAILPLLSGEHSLELVVINKLEIEGEEASRNELTKTATVKVDVSVKYMLTNFLKVHWKWLVATLGTVVAYFLNRKRKSKVK